MCPIDTLNQHFQLFENFVESAKIYTQKVAQINL